MQLCRAVSDDPFYRGGYYAQNENEEPKERMIRAQNLVPTHQIPGTLLGHTTREECVRMSVSLLQVTLVNPAILAEGPPIEKRRHPNPGCGCSPISSAA